MMNATPPPDPARVPPKASFARRVGRALRLRCPNCGGGPLLEGWFRLRARCPVCGLRTERGEQDFFLGAMVINITIAEGVLVLFFVGLVIALWPDVPWTFLQWGAPALMLAAPFLFYPFSKTLWMAVDLQFRPLTPEELDWHRESGDDAFRPERER